MRSDEIRAAGQVLGDVLGGGSGVVEQMHRTISQRPFGALGPIALPVRVIHDRVACTVYAAVRAACRAIPEVGGRLLAQMRPADAPALAGSRVGSVTLGALNGLWGDELARRAPELALSMTLRSRGEDVPVDAAAVVGAFPDAGGRVAVFVHGLCETDEAWYRSADEEGEGSRVDYGARLREDLGWTPAYVRYNSGLHVSDNGRHLADLLEDLVDVWPVAVDELALIGNSMGGLVARSACRYGDERGQRWIGRLRHVFCLGTPHLGAPLEKAVNVAAWALSRFPETRPFAQMVNARSAGVKDLRFGAVIEGDWRDHDPDEFLKDRCNEVPFVPSATYYFIGVTLDQDADGALSSILGDLLVRYPSASGRGRRRLMGFEVDNGRHLGGLHHFDLLHHPAVYAQLRAWLSRSTVTAALPQDAPL